MKESVIHPEHGAIVYDENIFSGKVNLFINGVYARPFSKKEFLFEEKKVVIKGSFLTGVTLVIGGESIEISPKPKWYEILLAILPFAFLLVWGNDTELCAIFPVVGGAIGGGLGGLGMSVSLFLMKKTKSPLYKALIGLGCFAAIILIAFVLAIIILSSIA